MVTVSAYILTSYPVLISTPTTKQNAKYETLKIIGIIFNSGICKGLTPGPKMKISVKLFSEYITTFKFLRVTLC